MEKQGLRPYFVLLVVVLLFACTMAFTVDVSLTNESGIGQVLPERVGNDWVGDLILYCHNSGCGKQYLASELQGNLTVCPACGGKLMSISPVEHDILPHDTYITRMLYKNELTGRTLHATLVMSGEDRSSIHRPQVCLVGQGNEITGQHAERIELAGRSELEVMVLDMMRTYGRAEDVQQKYPSFYTYWFVGKNRETAYHWERMFWMAYDRILKNVSHRWSYIAVMGSGEYAARQEEVDAFISAFYPQIIQDEELRSYSP